MASFLYFALAGILLYLSNWFWLKFRNRLLLSTYLLSGTISGISIGLLIKSIYNLQGPSWLIVPIIAISASFLLFIFAKYDLYQKPFFQLFGTISLGVCTGLVSVGIVKIFQFTLSSQMVVLFGSRNLLLDMIINGFLLNFGYAFSGRFMKKRRPRKSSD